MLHQEIHQLSAQVDQLWAQVLMQQQALYQHHAQALTQQATIEYRETVNAPQGDRNFSAGSFESWKVPPSCSVQSVFEGRSPFPGQSNQIYDFGNDGDDAVDCFADDALQTAYDGRGFGDTRERVAASGAAWGGMTGTAPDIHVVKAKAMHFLALGMIAILLPPCVNKPLSLFVAWRAEPCSYRKA
jgi:hypothetical protein